MLRGQTSRLKMPVARRKGADESFRGGTPSFVSLNHGRLCGRARSSSRAATRFPFKVAEWSPLIGGL